MSLPPSIRELINLVDETNKLLGKIDVLICNAGISIRSLFENVDLKIFKKLFNINFFGAIYGSKFSLPYLEKTKGTIIAISSLNGFIATPTRSAYVASKHAMQGFFDSLRLELLNKEINVMVISPGYVKSNFRLNTLKSDGRKEGPSSRDSKKMIKTMGEKCKVSIRNIRREANEELKKLLKAKEIGEDEEKSSEKNVQTITDDHIKVVDEKVSLKEKEIMTI